MSRPCRRWLRIVVALAALLPAGCGSFWWWLTSDGDLQAIDARARAEGVPATWADLAWRSSPPARIAAAKAVFDPKRRCAWSVGHPGTLPEVGQPVPAAMARYLAALPAERLPTAQIDALGGDPVVVSVTPRNVDDGIDLSGLREVASLLQERAMVAAPAACPAEILRLIRCARLVPLQLPVDLLRRSLVIARAAQATAYRLDDLRDGDPVRTVAEALRAAARDLRVGVSPAIAGQWVQMRQAAPKDLAIAIALSREHTVWPLLEGRILARRDRAALLALHLDARRAMGDDPQPWVVWARDPADDGQTALQRWIGNAWLREVRWQLAMQIRSAQRAGLQARVVAAALDDREWPRDPYDPQHRPVLRVERDGVLVGAYCREDDGRDPGAAQAGKDRRWPLRAGHPWPPPGMAAGGAAGVPVGAR